jgi:hypothetical protein
MPPIQQPTFIIPTYRTISLPYVPLPPLPPKSKKWMHVSSIIAKIWT